PRFVRSLLFMVRPTPRATLFPYTTLFRSMGLGYTTPPHRRAHLDRSRVTGSTEQLIEQLRGARFDADEAHTRSIFSFRLFQAIAHSSLELDLEIFTAHRQGNRDPAILIGLQQSGREQADPRMRQIDRLPVQHSLVGKLYLCPQRHDLARTRATLVDRRTLLLRASQRFEQLRCH